LKPFPLKIKRGAYYFIDMVITYNKIKKAYS